MKKFFVATAFMLSVVSVSAAATPKADKILGVYAVTEEGRESKVRFTKQSDGTYQGQIFWLKNPNNADGTPRYDLKNPDEQKRKVRSDNVVVVYGIRYDAEENEWNGGKVYNPADGNTYKVEISFDDPKTLRVRGKLGPIGKSRYWKKLE